MLATARTCAPVLVPLPPPPPVQLGELVRKIQSEKLVVQSIKLSGHADRLNSTLWARQLRPCTSS